MVPRKYYEAGTEKGVLIFSLMLDNASVQQILEMPLVFENLLNERECKKVIINLADTGFVHTVVIASLVVILKKAKTATAELVVCGVQDNVRRIFEIANLDRIFTLYENKQDAMEHFGHACTS
ncbi:MAG: STAS domain-containing protein [Candidatus Omnitrophota bacterium]